MNPSPQPTPQILLASADPLVNQRVVELLEEWHYPHCVVQDGPTALRLLTHEDPPAIALIDHDLSGIDGVQVIQAVRQRYDQRQTWLMMLGAHADAGGVRTAAEAGADDFLLKPIDESDFRVRLRVAERVQSLMLRVQQEAEATRFHATHDPLTRLLNRDTMLKELFQETDRVQRMKTPLAYLLLDVDSFSLINLRHGYDFGDRLLHDLGSRLKRYLRSYDLACRYGEDEFLVALPGCSAPNLRQMAERMRKNVLDKPFDIGKDRVEITASIGAAHSRGRSPLVVLRELERSLAQAKMEGRNCIRDVGDDGDNVAEAADPLLLRVSAPTPSNVN
jgi:two-component system, cell cycle response regulator